MPGMRKRRFNGILYFCVVAALLGISVHGAAQKRVLQAKTSLTRAQQKELNQIADMAAQGKPERMILTRWEVLIRKLAQENDGQVDVDRLVQQVDARARAGIEQNARSQQTQQAATQPQAPPELRQALRAELQLAHAALNDMRAGKAVKFEPANLQKFLRGSKRQKSAIQLKSAKRPKLINDPKTLEQYIGNLGSDLQASGNDSQMAQLGLQSATQRQAQTMQTLSSIKKSMHDTAKAIINNMR